jgi:hypothetical protein
MASGQVAELSKTRLLGAFLPLSGKNAPAGDTAQVVPGSRPRSSRQICWASGIRSRVIAAA